MMLPPSFATRSAIACNNQIRCFVKNHPRCIQSRSIELRTLKSEDPGISILLSCFFQLEEYISGWLHTFDKLIRVKNIQSSLPSTFLGGGRAKTDDGLLSWLHDCVWILLHIYICIKKSQVPNLFFYCINNLWQLMTRAVLMKVSRKVVLWGTDPLFT